MAVDVAGRGCGVNCLFGELNIRLLMGQRNCYMWERDTGEPPLLRR